MMKILQTIAGLAAKGGGTSTCTYDLLSAMQRIGCPIDLLTVDAPDLLGKGESWIKALPNDSKTGYGYSLNISRFLAQHTYDLYHTNGLWMHCNHVTCAMARKKGKPYIITPHGMLYPQALKRSYWKKWPLIQLYFNKDIIKATCLHATCKQELDNIRLFGYRGPVAVIANPAVIPANSEKLFLQKQEDFLGCNRPKKFGFLGRLHPIKKVENLLYGMSVLPKSQQVELVIMGKGDADYEAFLHSEVKRLGLNNVTFAGFINGEAKYEMLASFSALFVPSDFENFGMIVTEALSVGTPVMASLGTPWEELNTYRCGWWVDRTPENITKVMNEIVEMSATDLLAMGKRGMQLVQANYTAESVALKMQRLYEWILKGGAKPEFIYE